MPTDVAGLAEHPDRPTLGVRKEGLGSEVMEFQAETRVANQAVVLGNILAVRMHSLAWKLAWR